MNDLRDLYQETILDHYRQPRNFGPLENANHIADGFNPLCGDKLSLYLRVQNGIIEDIHFEGSGCAIATASASLMTEYLKGKSQVEALQLITRFHGAITGGSTNMIFGKLEVLAGVSEFPERVKCATLAWHTMKAALENEAAAVTTE